jgi:hypothetical protein
MARITLPLELYSLIFDYLRTDLQTLRNSCFLDYGITELCQSLIFRSVILHAQRSSGPLPDTICFKFHRLLCNSPHIAHLVKDLTIYDVDPYDDMETPDLPKPPRLAFVTRDVCLPYVLGMLHALTRLALWVDDSRPEWSYFSAMLQAAFVKTARSPRLDSIKFRGIGQVPIDLLRSCRALKHLELLYCDVWVGEDVNYEFDPALNDVGGKEERLTGYQAGDETQAEGETETDEETESVAGDASDDDSSDRGPGVPEHGLNVAFEGNYAHDGVALPIHAVQGTEIDVMGGQSYEIVEEDWGDDSEDGSYIASEDDSSNDRGWDLGGHLTHDQKFHRHLQHEILPNDLPRIQLETFAPVLEDSRMLIGQNSPFDLTRLKHVAIWISSTTEDEYMRWNRIFWDNADTLETLRLDCRRLPPIVICQSISTHNWMVVGDSPPPLRIHLARLNALRSLQLIFPMWTMITFSDWISEFMSQFKPAGPLRGVTVMILLPCVTELVSPEDEDDVLEWPIIDDALSRLTLLTEVKIWFQPQTGDARDITGLSLVKKGLKTLHRRGILTVERVATDYHTRNLNGFAVVHH